ncbi:MAG: alanine racemase [Ruminococcaceae bacterium]|nr:alanine racemase [Oscillospiraceae bacterium]
MKLSLDILGEDAKMNSYWKRLWTEISLDNLVYNFNTLKSSLPNDTAICCVVKANAYGHHAPRIAKTLEREGADCFAVSNIEEALQLRLEGIRTPILILGYTPTDCAGVLAKNDITQCVYSYDYATELARYATEAGARVRVHVKIDTGMGRIGFNCVDDIDASVEEISKICALDSLEYEGIFTHFAVSDTGDKGKAFTEAQYEKFINVTEALSEKGINFKYKHCANSAATLDYPHFGMNMVRLGIVLYGLLPSDQITNTPFLKPVMSLKTVVSHVKYIDAGSTVSYGCDFIAKKRMKVATVPMGYADGFWRSNKKMPLTINGVHVPIIGRICMDQLMIDVSDVANVNIGDEVTVFGYGIGVNNVDDFAAANNTINYEIICSVGKRVPRVFIENGEVVGIHLGMLDSEIN